MILYAGIVDLLCWRISILQRLEAILSISARFVKTTMICHSLRLTVVTGPHGNPDRDWPETFLLDSHATIAT